MEQTIKLNLDMNEQNSLRLAYQSLDGYEVISKNTDGTEKIIRIPYKLGAARRTIVKNLNTLQISFDSLESTKKSLFKEIWPNKEITDVVEQKDDPDNFNRFVKEFDKILALKEEINLIPLYESNVYNDNEFPMGAITCLDHFGLIISG